MTQSLSEITYQVLRDEIFWMSFDYERKTRIDGQDTRRIAFDKNIEYLNYISKEFAEYERQKLNIALKENPFVD